MGTNTTTGSSPPRPSPPRSMATTRARTSSPEARRQQTAAKKRYPTEKTTLTLHHAISFYCGVERPCEQKAARVPHAHAPPRKRFLHARLSDHEGSGTKQNKKIQGKPYEKKKKKKKESRKKKKKKKKKKK